MDTSNVNRVADFQAVAAKPNGAPVPEHLKDLPGETHIVTGSIVGHGTTELASPLAKFDAKVVSLQRNAAGGIDYQVAIIVSEPEPLPAAVPDPKLAPLSDRDQAIAYFKAKGLSDDASAKQVDRFGVPRVLAARDRELDAELAKVASAPTAEDQLPLGPAAATGPSDAEFLAKFRAQYPNDKRSDADILRDGPLGTETLRRQ